MGITAFLCGDGMHFYHESINGRKIAGCLLGLLGVFVVNLGKGVLAVRFLLGEGLCFALLCHRHLARCVTKKRQRKWDRLLFIRL